MKRILNQKGQSLVEYLVIVALVGVSGIAIMRSVGQNVNVQFAKVAKALGGEVRGTPKADAISETAYKRKDLRNFMSGSISNQSGAANNSGSDSSNVPGQE
jgi:Flp pilus assembly pilin Flp